MIEAGYTVDDLEDLSDEEKGGLLLQDKDTEEQEEPEAKADDKEALEAIAADENPPEGKADPKPTETGLSRNSTSTPSCLSIGRTMPEFSMDRMPH